MKELERILVLGGGAMGSALAHSFAKSGCSVKVLYLPYDTIAVENCSRGLEHPSSGMVLEGAIEWQLADEVSNEEIENSDLLIIAVSSEGLSWSENWLEGRGVSPKGLMFATKGVTLYRDLEGQSPFGKIKGDGRGKLSVAILGGPCLANELATGKPTSLVVACSDEPLSDGIRNCLIRLPYVKVEVTNRVLEVAWCTGLKNLYAIAISAIDSANSGNSKNATSGAFVQSIEEMQEFLTILGLDHREACGLVGVGDLYVTLQGGRNGKFGRLLGRGKTKDEIINGEMKGITIEGVHTAQAMASVIENIELRKKINWEKLSLLKSLLDSIIRGEKFSSSPWTD